MPLPENACKFIKQHRSFLSKALSQKNLISSDEQDILKRVLDVCGC